VADALKGGDAAKVGTELTAAAKKLDKAAAKGVIHKNKAARMKSRLARKANAATAKS
jgi:small subunit ribosomal protein S20